jgi:molecular chaperone GrpE (heat shock protein)
MPQAWFIPLPAIVRDHARALEGLGEAIRECSQLPVKTGVRLLTGDSRPSQSPQKRAEETISALHQELQQTQQAFEALLQRSRQAQDNHALEIARWQVEAQRVHGESQSRVQQALDDQKRQFLAWVESSFLQLPLVEHALAQGHHLSAQDLVMLLAPFKAALAAWGVELIGHVGQTQPFHPMHHEVVGPPPVEGSPVTIRQPGYRLHENIVRRAQVVKITS